MGETFLVNTIYQGNSLEILTEIPNEFVDCVITDPPYGISSEVKITRTRNTMKFKTSKDLNYNFGEWDKFENIHKFMEFTYKWVDEIDRILKKGGMFISYFDRDKINFLSHYLQGKGYKSKGYYADCKCLSGDSEIYILRGKFVRRITIKELYEDYQEDDYILTPEGYKKILAIKKNKVQPLYELKTYFGNIIASKNHIFPIFKQERWQGTRKKKSPLKRIKTKLNKIQYKTVYELKNYKWQKFLLVSPIKCQETIKEIDGFKLDYDFGWIIGLFLAEGNYNKNTQIRFSLNAKEIEYYKKIKTYFESLSFYNSKMQPNGIKVYRFIKNNGMVVYFGSEKVKEVFSKIIIGQGAHKKRINPLYTLNTNFKFRKGILDGFLAGDGYIDKKKKQVSFGVCNRGLRNDIQLLAGTLGYLTSITEHNVSYQNGIRKVYRLYFITKRKLREGIDSDLERDFNFYPVKILKIEDIGGKESYDLSVEGKLFIFNQGFISHNSNPVPQARKVKWMNGWEMVGLWQKEGGKLTYNYKEGQHKDYGIRPIVGGKERTEHPTQKPKSVIADFIRWWTNEEDIILDPFCGSGTTLLVAKKLGRKYIGIDINPAYCKLAEKRIETECGTLF